MSITKAPSLGAMSDVQVDTIQRACVSQYKLAAADEDETVILSPIYPRKTSSEAMSTLSPRTRPCPPALP
jgi:hypothetical protein